MSASSDHASEPTINDIMDQIKHKRKLFLDNKKSNANNLVDIISYLETDDTGIRLACFKSLQRIFTQLISSSDMFLEKPPKETSVEGLDKNEQYTVWLRSRYDDVKSRLLNFLSHNDSKIQDSALTSLMKFIEAEGQEPLWKISKNHLYFPVHIYQPVMSCLLSDQHDMTSPITRLVEYLIYDDIRYYTMKNAFRDLKEKIQQENVSTVFKENLFTILEKLSLPDSNKGESLQHFISKPPDVSKENLKINTLKEHRKLFTSLWLEFLKLKLPSSIYRKVLVRLPENVMPHLTSPILLSDFLTESYNIGGGISLLALNGLFILVNSYNLEYPDFYPKLYALFEPSVFHVKYRARFFHLADLFLTSTHLPAYMVAAFIKKLSRLSLSAPVTGQLILLPFIYNLFIRHPSCQVLIHNPAAINDLNSDPYKMDEQDLTKCCALESSVWEIKCLQSHYHPAVASEARKLEQPLPKQEVDLRDLLEISGDELMEKEMKRKWKEIPTNFVKPSGLFSEKDCVSNELWKIK